MKKLLSLAVFMLLFTSACAFVGDDTERVPLIAFNATSTTPTKTPQAIITPLSPTSSTQIGYEEVSLFCETYIETAWGDGPGQWGWPDGLDNRLSTLLPLEFDDTGRLYFADYINLRLLRYDELNSPPMEISLNSFTLGIPFYFSLDVYQDEILVPYGKNIGILSADTGDFIGNIQLPGYHYDPYYLRTAVIKVDKKGRLYVFGKTEEYYSPIRSVFFEPGWRDGNWEEVKISEKIAEDMKHITNPYFWDNYIVSESYGVSKTVVVYQSSLEDQTFLPIDSGLPQIRTPALFGVDNNGNAYLIASLEPPIWTYAKYNLLTHQMQVGQMRVDTSYTIAVPSVSPDGILYILTYSDKDLSVSPRIIKCEFPER